MSLEAKTLGLCLKYYKKLFYEFLHLKNLQKIVKYFLIGKEINIKNGTIII